MEKVLVDQFICEKCSTVLSSARSCSHIKTNDAVQAVVEHDQEVKRLALITQLEKSCPLQEDDKSFRLAFDGTKIVHVPEELWLPFPASFHTSWLRCRL